MYPLTEALPKPLIPICGKPLLEHIVVALPPSIDEIILVVHYKAEMIREYCGDLFLGKSIRYAYQDDPKAGTGNALMCAQSYVSPGTFLVMYGDDIHGARALAHAVTLPHAMLAAHAEHPERFGVVSLDERGFLKAIIEKPEHPLTSLVSIGGFVVTDEIFSFSPERSHLGEFLLVDMINEYTKRNPLMVVEQDVWIPVGYPDDIAKAERLLCPSRAH